MKRSYNTPYTGPNLSKVAFPLGGLGAGMVCLEGAGSLSSVSIRGRSEVFHEPMMFSAISIKGSSANTARVLEGPVPSWKVFFPWPNTWGGGTGSGHGGGGKTYGLPRFANASFRSHFPFGVVSLDDPTLPLTVELTGWSPFIPGQADDSSLPVAALEYAFTNRSKAPVEAVYSFHATNVIRDWTVDQFYKAPSTSFSIRRLPQGFAHIQDGHEKQPWSNASFAASTDAPGATVDCRWFRGGWFDGLTFLWKTIAEGQMSDSQPYTEGDPGGGASLFVPLKLNPGETKTVRVRLAWYAPETNQRHGKSPDDLAAEKAAKAAEAAGDKNPAAPVKKEMHRPWYAGRFANVEAVDAYWQTHYDRLRKGSQAFADCFYDTTLPPEVVEAVAANLSILKSPTVLRQTDGRLWLWEGSADSSGSCHGSCTHVWNYAQAFCHLFPDLERTLRNTEFNESQDDRGHQTFRSALPIRTQVADFHAASDGQLGGIMKIYRDWRISNDIAWLRKLWPLVKKSLDYCIATWDPDHEGQLKEPHHNTYDIEFWGPDGMCGSFYAGALRAACLIAEALGEPAPLYTELYSKAKSFLENELFDGEYFIQKIQSAGLHAKPPDNSTPGYPPEALVLALKEGPKYQYGIGCLSDGIMGAWLAEACGVGEILDPAKVRSHLKAVHKHNFRTDLSTHVNTQRPTYALGNEAGLLLCSWPKGGALTMPFVYSNEVWTGIEYQVASHLMMMGCVEEGLEIVRAVRDRYDGQIRCPFDEYECGHWYGRALASYALIQGLTGQRYDAVEKTLYLSPRIKGDWRAFLCTATGFGTVGVRGGEPFVEVKYGTIDIGRMEVEN